MTPSVKEPSAVESAIKDIDNWLVTECSDLATHELFVKHADTILASLRAAQEPEPEVDLGAAVGWLRTIIELPKTMTYCGHFTEEYKAGNHDGLVAAKVAAEQALKALLPAAKKGGGG